MERHHCCRNLILHNLIAQAPTDDNDMLIQNTLGISREVNTRQVSLLHDLHKTNHLSLLQRLALLK